MTGTVQCITELHASSVKAFCGFLIHILAFACTTFILLYVIYMVITHLKAREKDFSDTCFVNILLYAVYT